MAKRVTIFNRLWKKSLLGLFRIRVGDQKTIRSNPVAVAECEMIHMHPEIVGLKLFRGKTVREAIA